MAVLRKHYLLYNEIYANNGRVASLISAYAIVCDISNNQSDLVKSLSTIVIFSQLLPALAPIMGGYPTIL